MSRMCCDTSRYYSILRIAPGHVYIRYRLWLSISIHVLKASGKNAGFQKNCWTKSHRLDSFHPHR